MFSHHLLHIWFWSLLGPSAMDDKAIVTGDKVPATRYRPMGTADQRPATGYKTPATGNEAPATVDDIT